MARPRPEDIECINRLKFGSQFNYTPEHHSKEDVESDKRGSPDCRSRSPGPSLEAEEWLTEKRARLTERKFSGRTSSRSVLPSRFGTVSF